MKIFLAIILLFFVACSSDTSSGPGRQNMVGTSDSGGGNGVENKVYEAYIVQTDQLPAYKQIILPKINQLSALSPDAVLFQATMKKWLLYKTWYIAPVELGTISKEVIGVSFSSDKTEQLALQTKKSVWINDQRFNRMSIQDQAALIVHEMVMSLYYLKFKSWNDICAEEFYPASACAQGDIMEELFPGTAPKPFASDDYENMRAAVGIFLGENNFKSTEEIDSILIKNNFDRRFTFGLGLSGSSGQSQFIFNNSEKISTTDFENIFKSSIILNKNPDQCLSMRFKQEFQCQFNFNRGSAKTNTGFAMPAFFINVQSLDSAYNINFKNMNYIMGENFEGSSIELVSQKKKLFYFTFRADPVPTPAVVGTLFRSATVVFVQDLEMAQPQLTLLGVISTPGIITALNSSSPLGCTFSKPNPTSAIDDVLLVYSNANSDFEKNLLKIRATSMPVFTSCLN